MEILENVLTAEDYVRLFQDAGWGDFEMSRAEILLKKSYVTFAAVENGTVIGMVRLLGDGVWSFFMKDLIVDASYQGQGIGRKLLVHLCDYVRKEANGYPVWLELSSVKGKEPFYEKCGFIRRPTEDRGCGMYRIVE